MSEANANVQEAPEKKSSFQDFVMPVIILVLVCVVTTALLAATNSVTAPVIEANNEASSNETRYALLPEASGFTAYEGELLTSSSSSVSDVYTADNGEGTVMTLVTKSFGGDLTMMVGFDADGAITGVSISDHSDTPGVGTNNMTDDYLGQYVGLTSLTSSDVKSESSTLISGGTFEYVSGASVTGAAMHDAVYLAFEQLAAMG